MAPKYSVEAMGSAFAMQPHPRQLNPLRYRRKLTRRNNLVALPYPALGWTSKTVVAIDATSRNPPLEIHLLIGIRQFGTSCAR
ncbi:hypothetical protein [Altererythrobacter lutimaris]|uniref:hypothetical protein n=1 Tax=Altererythrobacter lutimaris TaxID=2743979 RepID=UPI001594335B|nr:hypothetical protein [Altererythrobacter lutimaris]